MMSDYDSSNAVQILDAVIKGSAQNQHNLEQFLKKSSDIIISKGTTQNQIEEQRIIVQSSPLQFNLQNINRFKVKQEIVDELAQRMLDNKYDDSYKVILTKIAKNIYENKDQQIQRNLSLKSLFHLANSKNMILFIYNRVDELQVYFMHRKYHIIKQRRSTNKFTDIKQRLEQQGIDFQASLENKIGFINNTEEGHDFKFDDQKFGGALNAVNSPSQRNPFEFDWMGTDEAKSDKFKQFESEETVSASQKNNFQNNDGQNFNWDFHQDSDASNKNQKEKQANKGFDMKFFSNNNIVDSQISQQQSNSQNNKNDEVKEINLSDFMQNDENEQSQSQKILSGKKDFSLTDIAPKMNQVQKSGDISEEFQQQNKSKVQGVLDMDWFDTVDEVKPKISQKQKSTHNDNEQKELTLSDFMQNIQNNQDQSQVSSSEQKDYSLTDFGYQQEIEEKKSNKKQIQNQEGSFEQSLDINKFESYKNNKQSGIFSKDNMNSERLNNQNQKMPSITQLKNMSQFKFEDQKEKINVIQSESQIVIKSGSNNDEEENNQNKSQSFQFNKGDFMLKFGMNESELRKKVIYQNADIKDDEIDQNLLNPKSIHENNILTGYKQAQLDLKLNNLLGSVNKCESVRSGSNYEQSLENLDQILKFDYNNSKNAISDGQDNSQSLKQFNYKFMNKSDAQDINNKSNMSNSAQKNKVNLSEKITFQPKRDSAQKEDLTENLNKDMWNDMQSYKSEEGSKQSLEDSFINQGKISSSQQVQHKIQSNLNRSQLSNNSQKSKKSNMSLHKKNQQALEQSQDLIQKTNYLLQKTKKNQETKENIGQGGINSSNHSVKSNTSNHLQEKGIFGGLSNNMQDNSTKNQQQNSNSQNLCLDQSGSSQLNMQQFNFDDFGVNQSQISNSSKSSVFMNRNEDDTHNQQNASNRLNESGLNNKNFSDNLSQKNEQLGKKTKDIIHSSKIKDLLERSQQSIKKSQGEIFKMDSNKSLSQKNNQVQQVNQIKMTTSQISNQQNEKDFNLDDFEFMKESQSQNSQNDSYQQYGFQKQQQVKKEQKKINQNSNEQSSQVSGNIQNKSKDIYKNQEKAFGDSNNFNFDDFGSVHESQSRQSISSINNVINPNAIQKKNSQNQQLKSQYESIRSQQISKNQDNFDFDDFGSVNESQSNQSKGSIIFNAETVKNQLQQITQGGNLDQSNNQISKPFSVGNQNSDDKNTTNKLNFSDFQYLDQSSVINATQFLDQHAQMQSTPQSQNMSLNNQNFPYSSQHGSTNKVNRNEINQQINQFSLNENSQSDVEDKDVNFLSNLSQFSKVSEVPDEIQKQNERKTSQNNYLQADQAQSLSSSKSKSKMYQVQHQITEDVQNEDKSHLDTLLEHPQKEEVDNSNQHYVKQQRQQFQDFFGNADENDHSYQDIYNQQNKSQNFEINPNQNETENKQSTPSHFNYGDQFQSIGENSSKHYAGEQTMSVKINQSSHDEKYKQELYQNKNSQNNENLINQFSDDRKFEDFFSNQQQYGDQYQQNNLRDSKNSQYNYQQKTESIENKNQEIINNQFDEQTQNIENYNNQNNYDGQNQNQYDDAFQNKQQNEFDYDKYFDNENQMNDEQNKNDNQYDFNMNDEKQGEESQSNAYNTFFQGQKQQQLFTFDQSQLHQEGKKLFDKQGMHNYQDGQSVLGSQIQNENQQALGFDVHKKSYGLSQNDDEYEENLVGQKVLFTEQLQPTVLETVKENKLPEIDLQQSKRNSFSQNMYKPHNFKEQEVVQNFQNYSYENQEQQEIQNLQFQINNQNSQNQKDDYAYNVDHMNQKLDYSVEKGDQINFKEDNFEQNQQMQQFIDNVEKHQQQQLEDDQINLEKNDTMKDEDDSKNIKDSSNKNKFLKDDRNIEDLNSNLFQESVINPQGEDDVFKTTQKHILDLFPSIQHNISKGLHSYQGSGGGPSSDQQIKNQEVYQYDQLSQIDEDNNRINDNGAIQSQQSEISSPNTIPYGNKLNNEEYSNDFQFKPQEVQFDNEQNRKQNQNQSNQLNEVDEDWNFDQFQKMDNSQQISNDFKDFEQENSGKNKQISNNNDFGFLEEVKNEDQNSLNQGKQEQEEQINWDDFDDNNKSNTSSLTQKSYVVNNQQRQDTNIENKNFNKKVEPDELFDFWNQQKMKANSPGINVKINQDEKLKQSKKNENNSKKEIFDFDNFQNSSVLEQEQQSADSYGIQKQQVQKDDIFDIVKPVENNSEVLDLGIDAKNDSGVVEIDKYISQNKATSEKYKSSQQNNEFLNFDEFQNTSDILQEQSQKSFEISQGQVKKENNSKQVEKQESFDMTKAQTSKFGQYDKTQFTLKNSDSQEISNAFKKNSDLFDMTKPIPIQKNKIDENKSITQKKNFLDFDNFQNMSGLGDEKSQESFDMTKGQYKKQDFQLQQDSKQNEQIQEESFDMNKPMRLHQKNNNNNQKNDLFNMDMPIMMHKKQSVKHDQPFDLAKEFDFVSQLFPSKIRNNRQESLKQTKTKDFLEGIDTPRKIADTALIQQVNPSDIVDMEAPAIFMQNANKNSSGYLKGMSNTLSNFGQIGGNGVTPMGDENQQQFFESGSINSIAQIQIPEKKQYKQDMSDIMIQNTHVDLNIDIGVAMSEKINSPNQIKKFDLQMENDRSYCFVNSLTNLDNSKNSQKFIPTMKKNKSFNDIGIQNLQPLNRQTSFMPQNSKNLINNNSSFQQIIPSSLLNNNSNKQNASIQNLNEDVSIGQIEKSQPQIQQFGKNTNINQDEFDFNKKNTYEDVDNQSGNNYNFKSGQSDSSTIHQLYTNSMLRQFKETNAPINEQISKEDIMSSMRIQSKIDVTEINQRGDHANIFQMTNKSIELQFIHKNEQLQKGDQQKQQQSNLWSSNLFDVDIQFSLQQSQQKKDGRQNTQKYTKQEGQINYDKSHKDQPLFSQSQEIIFSEQQFNQIPFSNEEQFISNSNFETLFGKQEKDTYSSSNQKEIIQKENIQQENLNEQQDETFYTAKDEIDHIEQQIQNHNNSEESFYSIINQQKIENNQNEEQQNKQKEKQEEQNDNFSEIDFNDFESRKESSQEDSQSFSKIKSSQQDAKKGIQEIDEEFAQFKSDAIEKQDNNSDTIKEVVQFRPFAFDSKGKMSAQYSSDQSIIQSNKSRQQSPNTSQASLNLKNIPKIVTYEEMNQDPKQINQVSSNRSINQKSSNQDQQDEVINKDISSKKELESFPKIEGQQISFKELIMEDSQKRLNIISSKIISNDDVGSTNDFQGNLNSYLSTRLIPKNLLQSGKNDSEYIIKINFKQINSQKSILNKKFTSVNNNENNSQLEQIQSQGENNTTSEDNCQINFSDINFEKNPFESDFEQNEKNESQNKKQYLDESQEQEEQKEQELKQSQKQQEQKKQEQKQQDQQQQEKKPSKSVIVGRRSYKFDFDDFQNPSILTTPSNASPLQKFFQQNYQIEESMQRNILESEFTMNNSHISDLGGQEQTKNVDFPDFNNLSPISENKETQKQELFLETDKHHNSLPVQKVKKATSPTKSSGNPATKQKSNYYNKQQSNEQPQNSYFFNNKQNTSQEKNQTQPDANIDKQDNSQEIIDDMWDNMRNESSFSQDEQNDSYQIIQKNVNERQQVYIQQKQFESMDQQFDDGNIEEESKQQLQHHDDDYLNDMVNFWNNQNKQSTLTQGSEIQNSVKNLPTIANTIGMNNLNQNVLNRQNSPLIYEGKQKDINVEDKRNNKNSNLKYQNSQDAMNSLVEKQSESQVFDIPPSQTTNQMNNQDFTFEQKVISQNNIINKFSNSGSDRSNSPKVNEDLFNSGDFPAYNSMSQSNDSYNNQYNQQLKQENSLDKQYQIVMKDNAQDSIVDEAHMSQTGMNSNRSNQMKNLSDIPTTRTISDKMSSKISGNNKSQSSSNGTDTKNYVNPKQVTSIYQPNQNMNYGVFNQESQIVNQQFTSSQVPTKQEIDSQNPVLRMEISNNPENPNFFDNTNQEKEIKEGDDQILKTQSISPKQVFKLANSYLSAQPGHMNINKAARDQNENPNFQKMKNVLLPDIHVRKTKSKNSKDEAKLQQASEGIVDIDNLPDFDENGGNQKKINSIKEVDEYLERSPTKALITDKNQSSLLKLQKAQDQDLKSDVPKEQDDKNKSLQDQFSIIYSEMRKIAEMQIREVEITQSESLEQKSLNNQVQNLNKQLQILTKISEKQKANQKSRSEQKSIIQNSSNQQKIEQPNENLISNQSNEKINSEIKISQAKILNKEDDKFNELMLKFNKQKSEISQVKQDLAKSQISMDQSLRSQKQENDELQVSQKQQTNSNYQNAMQKQTQLTQTLQQIMKDINSLNTLCQKEDLVENQLQKKIKEIQDQVLQNNEKLGEINKCYSDIKQQIHSRQNSFSRIEETDSLSPNPKKEFNEILMNKSPKTIEDIYSNYQIQQNKNRYVPFNSSRDVSLNSRKQKYLQEYESYSAGKSKQGSLSREREIAEMSQIDGQNKTQNSLIQPNGSSSNLSRKVLHQFNSSAIQQAKEYLHESASQVSMSLQNFGFTNRMSPISLKYSPYDVNTHINMLSPLRTDMKNLSQRQNNHISSLKSERINTLQELVQTSSQFLKNQQFTSQNQIVPSKSSANKNTENQSKNTYKMVSENSQVHEQNASDFKQSYNQFKAILQQNNQQEQQSSKHQTQQSLPLDKNRSQSTNIFNNNNAQSQNYNFNENYKQNPLYQSKYLAPFGQSPSVQVKTQMQSTIASKFNQIPTENQNFQQKFQQFKSQIPFNTTEKGAEFSNANNLFTQSNQQQNKYQNFGSRVFNSGENNSIKKYFPSSQEKSQQQSYQQAKSNNDYLGSYDNIYQMAQYNKNIYTPNKDQTILLRKKQYSESNFNYSINQYKKNFVSNFYASNS